MNPLIKLLLQSSLILYIFYPLSLQAEPTITYSQLELQSSAITSAFYSGSIVLLIVFALFNVSSRNHIGLWYTLLFAIGLLFVACLDGTGANFLWANQPEVDRWLPLTVFLALNACGLLLAAHTLDTSSSVIYSRLRFAIKLTGYINLALIALIPFAPLIYLALWANLSFIFMIIAQVMTTMSWRTPKINPSEEALRFSSIFSSVTSLVFLAATIITGLIIWHQSQQANYSHSDFMYVSSRTIYLILSLSLITTFMAHIIGIQRDHDNALKLELQSARRAAKASEDKLKAERDFARMNEIAKQRRQHLSTASHDIRQPLVSLQLTLDKLRDESTAEQKPEYQQALKYIEQLAESYEVDPYEDTGNEVDENESTNGSTLKNTEEILPINLVFQTIQQMFGPEAETKNVELITVATSMSAHVDPSGVMRIISNLVSNALTHTESQKILLGCRRQGNSIRIDVYDQGEGLSQSEFQQMQQYESKGESSDGQGIGLASCIDIAESAGYELFLTSKKEKGSCFSLLIPRHFHQT